MGGSGTRLDPAISMSIGHITWGDGKGKQCSTCDGRAWNSISFSLNGKLKFLYGENGDKLQLSATLDIEKNCNVLFHNLITLLTTAIQAKGVFNVRLHEQEIKDKVKTFE